LSIWFLATFFSGYQQQMEQLKRKAKIVDTSNKDIEKSVQFIGGNHLENIATSGAVSRYYE